jgi:hypothetical protein
MMFLSPAYLPAAPSIDSRTMSMSPAWRAVSSTVCTSISPRVTSWYGLVGI